MAKISGWLNNKSRAMKFCEKYARTQAEKLKRKTLRVCCIQQVLFESILRANGRARAWICGAAGEGQYGVEKL